MLSALSTVLCPLRLPLCPGIRQQRRVSPVPRSDYTNIPLPLRRRVLRRCLPRSSLLPWPSPYGPGLGSLLFRSHGIITTRQYSLYATDCWLARSLTDLCHHVSTQQFPVYAGDQLRSGLAATSTGLSPVSLTRLIWTHVHSDGLCVLKSRDFNRRGTFC